LSAGLKRTPSQFQGGWFSCQRDADDSVRQLDGVGDWIVNRHVLCGDFSPVNGDDDIAVEHRAPIRMFNVNRACHRAD